MIKAPPTPDDWNAARARWEADRSLTFGQVGVPMGVSKQAVRQRAVADGWHRGPEARASVNKPDDLPAAPLPAGEPTVISMADVRAPAPTESLPRLQVGSTAARRDDIVQRHRKSWYLVQQLYLDAFQTGPVVRDGVTMKGIVAYDDKKLAAARTAAAALESMQRGERAAWEEEQLPEAPIGDTTYVTQFVNQLPETDRLKLEDLSHGRGGMPDDLDGKPRAAIDARIVSTIASAEELQAELEPAGMVIRGR